MRLSLRSRMLTFSFGIVAALTGLSLAVLHGFVARQTHRGVTDDLARTRSVFEKFMSERARWLRSQCWIVAQDPRFAATLDIQDPDLESQSRTVLREARRFQRILGGDHFLVTSPTGRVLARVHVEATPGDRLREWPTVASALRGRTEAGRVLVGEEYHVASAPVGEGAGTVSVGFSEPVAGSDLVADVKEAASRGEIRDALARPERAQSATRELLRAFGADLAALTDPAGAPLVLVRRIADFGGDLSRAPHVREALAGHDFTGLGAEGGRIVQRVVVPVWSRGEVIGTLGLAYEIDDRVAGDLRATMQSEVSFALDGRIVASTWPEAVRRELESRLRAQAGETPFEMTLGNESHLTLVGRLDMGPGENGHYVIQRSLDQALGFLTTLERALLGVGLGVLAAAALLSFVGVGRILRPLRSLVEGTRRLAAGQLAHRIPAGSGDEFGQLAGSFNEMAGALARSLDALAESERRYRDLFDHAQDVVYTCDLQMRLLSVNQTGRELLGDPAEELVGRSLYDLMVAEDAARLRSQDERLETGAPRPAFETRFRRPAGPPVTLEVVARWITEGGQHVGIHGIGRDISQRREREREMNRFREQVHQAEKLRALGEVAAGVAHNFNNLLNGISGYAQLMEMRTRTPEEMRRYARKIVEGAEQCAAIVKRIQSFGRPLDVTRVERMDLGQVVRDTIELTRPKWKSAPEREGRQIDVELDLAPLSPVESAAAVWEEIVSNLVFNAVDAMPQGGTLGIATRLEGDRCVLVVHDTGIGMNEETRRRIFEPFFTTKGSDLGTGLGLSTVWGLVKSEGGDIEVDSAPGQGTTFTIRVPAALAAALLAAEAPQQPTSPLCILVIDDDPTVRDVLVQMLAGHEVDAAASGAEGLERFPERRYDLVISDWSMSGLSGLEVAAEVKRRAAGTVVVLMTGWDVRGAASDYSPDLDFVLQKPIRMAELERVVSDAARLFSEGRSARQL